VITWVRSRFTRATDGVDTFPLAVLFALFFFDEFDTAAFTVLAPNIQDHFHLTDRAFGLLVIGNLSVVLALAVPVTFYGDRLPRTRMVVVGGVLAGVFSFLTGTATTLWVLVLYRLGNGVGRLVNDPVHTSLLADYYKPESRPRVFSLHRNGEQLGRVVGPAVAGIAAAIWDWRAAFLILIVPIVATSMVAIRLRDPRRGGTDDPDAAVDAEREDPPRFPEAARTLFAVPTLRRLYLSFVFVGAGLIPLAYYLPLFLEREFGVDVFWRGAIVSFNAAFTFAGVLLSGRWTARWLTIGMGEPLKRAGLVLVAVGIGLLLVAASPWLGLVVALGAATSFAAGVFTPPFVTTQAFVSPARVRTLSYGFGAVFILLGTWLLFIIVPVIRVSDVHGIRWGIVATVGYWIIGGLVLRSAHRFVADDTNRALQNLALTAQLRRERLQAGASALLLCRDVDVAYDGVQVLFGVDMEVHKGEIVALLGTNGAGKSTLLRAIAGVVDPVGGAIFFNGRDITHADPVTAAELGIVQVPGGKAVFPTLTVAEHFRAASWLMRDDEARVEAAREEMLQRFPRLRSHLDHLAGDISGGEQQMLALSMAFIAEPELLIIDELSLGLAPIIVEQLLEIVREIHARGTTVILVEQSVNVALTLASRAYFLEKGEVRFEGPTAELLERDDILRSVFLEGAVSLAASPPRLGPQPQPPPERGAPAGAPSGDGRVLLETRGLTKSFGGIRAVDDVDLEVHAGRIIGLIGPNGAGKTTVFDLLSGFLVPEGGRVWLDGVDVTTWAPDRRARAGLGRSFQDARIFPSLTVAENLANALERHLEIRDHLASALGLPAVLDQEDVVAARVAQLVDLMGLGAFRDKFARELSTGTRRVVDLAMTVAHDPAVLILDEPSSGIAQRETEALGPLLLRIRDETGCAMLVIEHDMPLVTSISDEIVALELGAVIARGSAADVVRDPHVVASYLGTDRATIARSGAAPA
jgi:branched-chain amino acid transport system ATP-binding protein